MATNVVENIPSQEENLTLPQCSICKKDYELDDIIVSTPEVLKETLGCPICGKACRQNKLAKKRTHLYITLHNRQEI